METKQIVVTADFSGGNRNDPRNCPLAQAVNAVRVDRGRKLTAVVDDGVVRLVDKQDMVIWSAQLGRHADLIEDFDSRALNQSEYEQVVNTEVQVWLEFVRYGGHNAK